MNILQITPYFYPAMAYGGPSRTVYELSKSLVRRGHEVTVFTTDSLDKNSRIEIKDFPSYFDGLEVYYFKNLSNSLAWNQQLFISSGMLKHLKNHVINSDIVHLNMYRTFQNVAAHYYCKKYGIPYVISARGSIPRIVRKVRLKQIYDVLWGKRILNDAQKVIGISKMEHPQYSAFGVSSDNISTIYNGIDIENYDVLPPRGKFISAHNLHGKKIILYLGRINARKGLDFLVKSFSNIAAYRNDFILIIAGPDDGYQQKLESLISSLGISDKVKFCGYMGYPEKIEAYVDAEIVVYPSFLEYFGLVPFEALLCNTPAVVTKESGCGEIIADMDIGYYVDYNDINGLSEVMTKIIENPTEAKNKAMSGRVYVQNNLYWDKVAQQTEKVYSLAIAESRVIH
jgi:glycosyltransferase involved in cell wall biosynthesis